MTTLRPYQREAVDAALAQLQQVRSTLIVMPTGTGKQQPLHTPVLTPYGWWTMGDLRVGDEVIGSDGRPVRVTGVFPQGIHPVYGLKLKDGAVIECGLEHLWSVRTKYDAADGKPFRTLSTKDILERPHLNWQLPMLSPAQYLPGVWSDLPVDPYTLGVYLGDGYGTSICTDEWICRFIGLSVSRRHESCPTTVYASMGNKVSRALTKLGVRVRSWEKFVPTEYIHASHPSQRHALLQGLLDTDGAACGAGVDFSSTSRPLAEAVRELALSLGGSTSAISKRTTNYTHDGERREGKTSWRVRIKMPADYPPFRLPRKRDAMKPATKYPPKRIIREVVDLGYEAEQVCISVDAGDSLYVTKDYVLTHNTTVFSEIIGGWNGRVLVLAHRSELIDQARERIEQHTGELCDVEQAERFAYCSRVVVGSMKSVAQKRRLYRLGRDAFSLIIIDEAHRSACESYQKILGWFSGAKVLGVTATPDRGDKKGLGDIFDSVAFEMDILDAIREGWLADVKAQRIYLDEIDISNVRSSAGDLQIGQLDDAMVAAAAGVAKESLEIIGPDDGQGIAFFPGIESGMMATEWLNKLRPGCARFVCGKTPPDEREQLFRDYRNSEFQFLVNVMVATEGFDHPPAKWIIMARPTKSRGLYAQCCGRGTRPLAKCIEGLETPLERRAAIATSEKPHCTILDFYGNTGKHSLIGPIDILGGSYTEAERKQAAKGEFTEKPESVVDALQAARKHLIKVARDHEARVKARREAADPFRASGLEEPDMASARFRNSMDPNAATEKQLAKLHALGVRHQEALTKKQASLLIDKYAELSNGKATDAQLRQLEKYLDTVPPRTPFTLARNALNYVDACRRHHNHVDPERLRSLITLGAQ